MVACSVHALWRTCLGWYEAVLVAQDIEDDCQWQWLPLWRHYLTVFFCMIMGSIAIGQISPPLSTVTSSRIVTNQNLGP